MRLDPKLIVEFAVIAQERSFTRAAQRLRVAQPWLSARFAKLEAIMGFRLLDRTTRVVTLTERGAAFLPVAEEMARQSEAADRLSLQLSRSERRVLRIGAAPSTKVIRQRHELLNDFALAQSEISLELESAWSVPLVTKLEAGEIDLSFMMGTVDPEKFDRILLAYYGVAISVAPSHEWAGRSFLRPDDLSRRRVQVFTRSLNQPLWDMLYAPLVEADCAIVEMPEMAEGSPSRMRTPEDIAAFFDFGTDDPGGPDVCRIPLKSRVAVPFQLLRSAGGGADATSSFWEMALRRQERDASLGDRLTSR